jgi:hypothetical protein
MRPPIKFRCQQERFGYFTIASFLSFHLFLTVNCQFRAGNSCDRLNASGASLVWNYTLRFVQRATHETNCAGSRGRYWFQSNQPACGFAVSYRSSGKSPNVANVLLQRLAPEVADNTFGEVTRSDVSMYQCQLKNWPNYWPPKPKNIATIVQSSPANCPGDVDAVTAQALNWLVETFRRIQSPSPARGKLRPAAILKKGSVSIS